MFENLDWMLVLQEIEKLATSQEGRLNILKTNICKSASEAEKSVLSIFQAQRILTQIRPVMESIDLFEPWIQRLRKKATLKTIEIKDVRFFCQEALALQESLKDLTLDSEWIFEMHSNLMRAEEPLGAIDQIITPSGDIRSDASEKLYNLYHEKNSLMKQVHQNLDRLVKDHQLETVLQDKYVTTREGRWVLPIRSGMRHHLDGIIHSTSQTKQTVYMEPELVVPLNNRIRQIEVEIEEEIERLLIELSVYLQTLTESFESSKKILLEVDIVLAKSQWSQKTQSQGFSFTDENKLELNMVRHPILVIQNKSVIANSVQLDTNKSILLLSGPNAGGKTVLLKSIGLAAQMSRCGLPILADSNSTLPFFENIITGIGDTQSIGEDLSTFAGHLKILNQATKLKGSKTLILVDEICGSTDPEEGSALARSFIEEFCNNKVFAVITSHLGPLKTGWKQEDRVLNGSMEYDRQSGRPTYQFLQGVAGDSLALQTAKRVGVSENLIDKAKAFLSPETRARLSAMEDLESMKHDLLVLQDHLRKELQQTKFEKSRLMAEKSKLEKERDQILAKIEKDANKKVEEAITHAKVEDTFKRHRTLQDIKFQLPEIVKSTSKTDSDKFNNNDPQAFPKTSDEFAKRFPTGSKIYIPKLSQDGILQSTPNNKGEVQILSGSLRLNIHWQELKSTTPASNKNNTSEILRRSSSIAPQFTVVEADRSLDLRGKTVQESIELLEIELDQASLRKEDRIKVIHGHGTEVLKKSVRAYLSRSLYVKKWKAGSPEQGGDGITWVELISNE